MIGDAFNSMSDHCSTHYLNPCISVKTHEINSELPYTTYVLHTWPENVPKRIPLHTKKGDWEVYRMFEMRWKLSRTDMMGPWWRHQMEIFSALLGVCAGNSPVTGDFPARRPVTRTFDVFFDLRLNKQVSKQSWGRWFETQSRPLWRHCNAHCGTYSDRTGNFPPNRIHKLSCCIKKVF